ncbi:protein Mis18-beta [Vanacampus margaritifer]
MEFNKTFLRERDDDEYGDAELLKRGRWATLHCKQCNTVLGDSLAVCGELKCLDSIMSCRVSGNVEVSSEMECGYTGQLANCIFSSLLCGDCGCAVGKVVHAAPPRLTAVRSLFLLHKAHVTCYVLDSSSMVNASAMSFEMEPLMKSISEVRQHFELNFEHVKSCLADIRSINSKLDE